MDELSRSAKRLCEKLERHGGALAMYQTEALYHMQVQWTCEMLRAVDEIADPVIGEMVADLIYERLTADGVSEAAQRQRDAIAECARLMREAPPPFSFPRRTGE